MSEEEIRLRPEVERLTLKLEADPKSRVFAQLADAYRKSHMVDEAIEVVKKGLQIHPDYAAGHLVLGRCYLEKQIHSLAREELERAANLDPSNSVVVMLLADALLAQGAKAEAIQRYQQILELDPLNSDVAEKLEKFLPQGEVRESGEESSEQSTAEVPSLKTPFPEGSPLSIEKGNEGTEDGIRGIGHKRVAISGEEEIPTEKTDAPEPAGSVEMTVSDVEGPPSHPEPLGTPLAGKEAGGAVADILINGKLGTPALSPPESPRMIAQKPIEVTPVMKIEQAPAAAGEMGATITLAELYEEQGFYDRALEIYERVLSEHPEDQVLQEKVRELKNRTEPASEVPAAFFSMTEVFGEAAMGAAEAAVETPHVEGQAEPSVEPTLREIPKGEEEAVEREVPAFPPEGGESKTGIKSFQEWLDALVKSKPEP